MAFTTAQKDAARGHLGYPITQWGIDYISEIMDGVAALSSDAETRIGAILTTLTAIETQLNTYRAASAGLQVLTDGSVYYQSGAIGELNNQYVYWRNKLAIALDISIYKSNNNPSSVIRG